LARLSLLEKRPLPLLKRLNALLPRWWKVPPLRVRLACLLVSLAILAWAIRITGG